jgi:transcriptional regulator with XRE-family HTH domain
VTEDGDQLVELIAEEQAANPRFGEWVAAADRRCQLIRALARRREECGLSKGQLARLLRTSAAFIDRIEASEVDPKLSILEEYAEAVGRRLEWALVEPPERQVAPSEPRAEGRAVRGARAGR